VTPSNRWLAVLALVCGLAAATAQSILAGAANAGAAAAFPHEIAGALLFAGVGLLVGRSVLLLSPALAPHTIRLLVWHVLGGAAFGALAGARDTFFWGVAALVSASAAAAQPLGLMWRVFLVGMGAWVTGAILAVVIHVAVLAGLGLGPAEAAAHRGAAEIIGAGVLFFCWSAALLWSYRRAGAVTDRSSRA
jgi:hypothetical protein